MSGRTGMSLQSLTFGVEYLRNTATIEDLLRMNGDGAFEALRALVAKMDDSSYQLFRRALKLMIDAERECVQRSESDCSETGYDLHESFGRHQSARLTPISARSATRLLSLQAFYAYAGHFRKAQTDAETNQPSQGVQPLQMF